MFLPDELLPSTVTLILPLLATLWSCICYWIVLVVHSHPVTDIMSVCDILNVSSVPLQLFLRRWSPRHLLNFFFFTIFILPYSCLIFLNFLNGPPAWVISTRASCAKVISRNTEKDQSAHLVLFFLCVCVWNSVNNCPSAGYCLR